MPQPPAVRVLRIRSLLLALPLAFAATAGAQVGAPPTPSVSPAGPPIVRYPETRKVEQVDDYHGTRVADPYRWLEDVDAADTKQWVVSQNAVTDAYLATIPERERIRGRLTKAWSYPKYGAPFREAGRWFFHENSGLQNQSVLYVTDALDGEKRVLLDPNTLTSDGTMALTTLDVSPTGKWLAYGVSGSGSDWQEFRVRDIATGKDLADTLKWIKFSGMSWTKDGRGFFYSRYERPEGSELTGVNRNQKLYYHRLGTPQSRDVLVYQRPDQPDWGVGADVTDDGRYAVVYLSEGTDPRNRIYVIDLRSPAAPKIGATPLKLFDRFDAAYTYVGNTGRTFYFSTTKDAPKGRVIAVDLAKPGESHWRSVIPESRDVLQGVEHVGGRLVARYLQDAKSSVRIFGLDGAPAGELQLPGIGYVSELRGRPESPELFFTFTSFLDAPSVYRHDLASGKTTVHKAPELPVDASRYETRQLFYTSRDGTRIPMFVTHRKGMALDGNNPTLLYGYGGFDVSMTPSFSPARLVWLEMGGVYAVANLRGGGEYGQEWHQAGTKERKQNVFDDFIAAAEYLVAERYTRPERLAIQGGSNGGLLVGAAMTQRPELFGVAIPQVGVMDMLRFHRFTIGWAWTSDYGSSDDAEGFRYLRAYSPLHNLKPGTRYPATLVTTADHDDRVVPGHSFKFAAALQAAQGGPAPVLIRIETKAGHGAGKPTSKRIDEAADIYAFIARNMGMAFDLLP
jgi:prolyl oligopeptidase